VAADAIQAGSKPHMSTKVLLRVGLTVVAVVAMVVAYALGAAGTKGAKHDLAQARDQLATAQTQLAVAHDQLLNEGSQLQSAQQQAKQATSNAEQQAQAKYASAMAALKQQQQTLQSDQKTLNTEQGQLQSSSISEDGVYVVGSDIKSGVWHTSGDGGQGDDACYYATLNSTNTDDISDNNNFDGAETVDLSGAYAFQISGPCTWYLVG
jgi:multidrug efflux pump subunit AcrA (membrane-fusion protein)